MIEIGKFNALSILREVDFGLYLDGEDLGEILLPKRYIPTNYEIGQFIDAFLYLDSEDRLVATTEKPLVMVGQFAALKVAEVNKFGAFLDWGLPKDILVPFREQKQKMEKGKTYVVYVYLDERTRRIVASSKTDRFLDKTPLKYNPGDKVNLLISNKTDMGFNAIINNTHSGVLYENEIFQKLHTGQKITGFIKKIREDHKIDLVLQKPGYHAVEGVSNTILEKLKDHGGYLKISDTSSAEEINAAFGVSKKTFKKALGALYKKRQIVIEETGIRLFSK